MGDEVAFSAGLAMLDDEESFQLALAKSRDEHMPLDEADLQHLDETVQLLTELLDQGRPSEDEVLPEVANVSQQDFVSLDFVGEVSRKCAGMTRRLADEIELERARRGTSSSSLEQLESLHERCAVALRRAGLPAPQAVGPREASWDVVEDEAERALKRTLVADINSLRSRDRATRLAAATRLREHICGPKSSAALRDAPGLGAMGALAAAFAAAARVRDLEIETAAATAIAALIPSEHEPSALLLHAPALLSALRLVLQQRDAAPTATTKSVAVAIAHFTVLLQQGWVGDVRDLTEAADDLATAPDRMDLLVDAGGYASPVSSWRRSRSRAKSGSRRRSTGTHENAGPRSKTPPPPPFGSSPGPRSRRHRRQRVDDDLEDGRADAKQQAGDLAGDANARRSTLARRTMDALVAVACDAAAACGTFVNASGVLLEETTRRAARGEAVDGGTRALIAFAMSNLAQLAAARPALVRRGALVILAEWLRSRPCSELHRHAASALSSVAGASDDREGASENDEPPISGAMAALSAFLPEPDVHTRGWIDARLTLKNGVVDALVPLASAPIAAVRFHVVAALAALVSRPPNRAAVVAAGGLDALLDVLARSVRDLRAPARRAAAASLAEQALVALTTLGLEMLWCPDSPADNVGRDRSGSLTATSGAGVDPVLPLEATPPVAPQPETELEVSGFLQEAAQRKRTNSRGGHEEAKDQDEGGLVVPPPPAEQRQAASDGVRVATLVIDRGAVPLMTAVVCLADPGSSLRLAAVRSLALLSDEDRGCGADRWYRFFERAHLPEVARLDGAGRGDEDDGASDDDEVPPKQQLKVRRLLLAPTAVDALIRLAAAAIAGAYSSPLNDIDRRQPQPQSSPLRQATGRPSDAAEATYAACVLANVASRPALAEALAWRHGATPVLARLARSRRLALRAYALRALASLAAPLVTAPAELPTLDKDAIDVNDAAAAAALVVDATLGSLDGTAISRGLRDPEGRRAHRLAAHGDELDDELLFDGSDAAEQLLYEAVRAVRALASAEPLRTPLVARGLRSILCIAIDARGASPQLRGMAEAALVTLGFEGGARDLQLCGNDDKLLEEWFAMRRALELQEELHEDYARALADAWPPPTAKPPNSDAIDFERDGGDSGASDSAGGDSGNEEDDEDEQGTVRHPLMDVPRPPLDADDNANADAAEDDGTSPRARRRDSAALAVPARAARTASEPATQQPQVSAPPPMSAVTTLSTRRTVTTAPGDQPPPHFWSEVRGTLRKVLLANPLARPGFIFRCHSTDVGGDDAWATDAQLRRAAHRPPPDVASPGFLFCSPGSALEDDGATSPRVLREAAPVVDLQAEGVVSPLCPYDASLAATRVVEFLDGELESRASSLEADEEDKQDAAAKAAAAAQSFVVVEPPLPAIADIAGPPALQRGSTSPLMPSTTLPPRTPRRGGASDTKASRGSDSKSSRGASETKAKQRTRRLRSRRQSATADSNANRDDEEADSESRHWQRIVAAAKKLPAWWAHSVERHLDEAEARAAVAFVNDDEDPCMRKQRRAGLLPPRAGPLRAALARRASSIADARRAGWQASSRAAMAGPEKRAELDAARVAAYDGEAPRRLARFLLLQFPSALQRRRVAPLHRVPGGSATWSPRITRVLALPSRQYFSFRREARVLARVIEQAPSSSTRWALLFAESRFAGEFFDSLASCLARLPTVESLAFSRSKTPQACTAVELDSGECPGRSHLSSMSGGSAFFGERSGASHDKNDDHLARLVGALPSTLQAVTLDRMLGREALQILGILLQTAEERRVRAVRELREQQAAEIADGKPSRAALPVALGGPALALLAVKNHDNLRPEDFQSLITYLRACVRTPLAVRSPYDAASAGITRSLRWIDLSGNRLADAGVAGVIAALDRPDSSVTALDVSNNSVGAFAPKILDALCRESADVPPTPVATSVSDHHLSEHFASPPSGATTPTAKQQGPKSYAGALFCGARLRYLSLAGNGLGPRAVSRLLTALVDVGAPTRATLRGLNLEGSNFGPPCAIGATAQLGAALRALAKHPGLLEELDLDHCRLQSDCVKELLLGLVEGRAAAAEPENHPSRTRPPGSDDDEFGAHESESETEFGKLYPPMPSLQPRTAPVVAVADDGTGRSLAPPPPPPPLPRSDEYDQGDDETDARLRRTRRRRTDPLFFLVEEEEDGTADHVMYDERGFEVARNEDEDYRDVDPASAAQRQHSRLSFIRMSEGNSASAEDISLIRDWLRRNRSRRIRRAAARRFFLRRSSSSDPRLLATATRAAREAITPVVVEATPAPLEATAVAAEVPRRIVFAEPVPPEPTPEDPRARRARAASRGSVAEPADECKHDDDADDDADADNDEDDVATDDAADDDAVEDGDGETGTRGRWRARPSKEQYSVCALFASPLAWQDGKGELHGIEALDFDAEREAIASALDAARRHTHGVRVRFDVATTERLRSYVTLGKCDVLQYSGHGHPQALTFEDGRGGLQPLTPAGIATLVNAGDEGGRSRRPKLAFVCACHSGRAAKALVDAGVPHVVAVALDSALLDAAAVAFTHAFYLALSVGDTVANAFAVGCEAVAASPQVNAATDGRGTTVVGSGSAGAPGLVGSLSASRPRAASVADLGRGARQHARKFVLLPEDGAHDVPIFPRLAGNRRRTRGRRGRPLPPPAWPPEGHPGGSDDDEIVGRRGFRRRYSPGLPTPPSPPDDFLGREVDVYKVVEGLARKRKLVSVVGRCGVGKSALVAAVSKYVSERRFFADGIVYLRLRGATIVNDVEAALRNTLRTARDRGRSDDESGNDPSSGDEPGKIAPLAALGDAQCLLVLDDVDAIDKAELRMMLNQLFNETRGVTVLVSSRAPLCRRQSPLLVPGSTVHETVVRLQPLSLWSAARLFARQCPQLHTASDRKEFHTRLAQHPDDRSAKQLRTAMARRVTSESHVRATTLAPDRRPVLSTRERRVLKALGGGFPADIVSRAFDTDTRQGLASLLQLAEPTPSDEVEDQIQIEATFYGGDAGDDDPPADDSSPPRDEEPEPAPAPSFTSTRTPDPTVSEDP